MISTFHRKVFKKLGFEVSDEVIRNLTSCKPRSMEQFLIMLRDKMTPVHSNNNSVTSSSATAVDNGGVLYYNNRVPASILSTPQSSDPQQQC